MSEFNGGRRRIANYGIAILGTLLTLLLTRKLDTIFGGQHPLFLYLAIVILTSLYGGFGPGAVAAVLATVFHNYFDQYPQYSMSVHNLGDFLELCVFFAVAGFLSWVGSKMR